MIDIERQLGLPQHPGGKLITNVLKALLHEAEINGFIQENQHLRGFAFLDKVLEKFHFSYKVAPEALQRIPPTGPLIIVANHPIGSLDGLALLKMVRSVRPDVRIVANELLSLIEPLGNLFIPVDNMHERNGGYKSQYQQMLKALKNEEAIIIFPAGEVSRIRPNGVRDGKWKGGFIKLAQKTGAPVQPIYIDARNSALFYTLSALYKPLGTLMLVQEMFNKTEQCIRFHIGHPIPATAFKKNKLRRKELAQLVRKHTYLLPRPKKLAKKQALPTQETIAPPVERAALKACLTRAQLLCATQDGKEIYLYEWEDHSALMKEIGRLRELTFRSVEEGTGRAYDLDAYDPHYQHLVLWDSQQEEVVGAYRIGPCARILDKIGEQGLYTPSLFTFHAPMKALLPQAIELGRTFVQPKYWGLRSLDYLWFGIGAYLHAHPQVRYMYGPVSISDAYPDKAKALIALFYQCQCPPDDSYATAHLPFPIPEELKQQWQETFSQDYSAAFKQLNTALAELGVKVPTLYKQYAEIAQPGGCMFIDFNIDPSFNYVVDGLVLVDIEQLVPKKKARYMSQTGCKALAARSSIPADSG